MSKTIEVSVMIDISETLYRLNPWWSAKFDLNFILRERYVSKLETSIDKKEVVFLTGLRRVGKTSLLKYLIHNLLKKVDKTKILYVPLDSIALSEFNIHTIVEEYRKLHKIKFEEKIYLFFDEVASKKEFERELKDFYDNENVKIFASSSSASLLKEKKGYLTGRVNIIEVLPLDFKEYLLFKNIKISKTDSNLYGSYFTDYMKSGGMPEYVLTGDVEYLNQLLQTIISKDIIVPNNISNEQVIRDLLKLLCERVGKTISYNKIAKILGISLDSVRRYVSYMEDVYLFYTVDRCGKTTERITAHKKIYIGDVGFKNIITGFRDKGAIYENLVFLKIKHEKPCYVYIDKTELDFKFDKTIIEAKYGSPLPENQKKLLSKFKKEGYTTKITEGYKFFL